MEDKLNKMLEEVHAIRMDLNYHIKRTDLLEKSMDQHREDMKSMYSSFSSMFKWVFGIMITVGTVFLTILTMIK